MAAERQRDTFATRYADKDSLIVNYFNLKQNPVETEPVIFFGNGNASKLYQCTVNDTLYKLE